MNVTDANGMCPSLNQSGVGNQIDALACHTMVRSLKRDNIHIIWRESPQDILNTWNECARDQDFAEFTINEDAGLRWTTREVYAIYNAFRVFDAAYRAIGMENIQYWPLSADNQVKYVKTTYSGALGKHQYSSRTIKLSASRWGEGSEIDGYNPQSDNNPNAYRSWLALHEFAHILIKDFAPAGAGVEDFAKQQLPAQMRRAGFSFSQTPTAYATDSYAELIVEVVTGTLWNNGAVPLFSEDGGGRTGTFNNPGTDYYECPWTVVNVPNIVYIVSRTNETAENWIIDNLLR